MATSEQFRKLAWRLADSQERERTRIARQLHDELGQALTIIKMNSAWLLDKGDIDREATAERLKASLALANEAIRASRKISSELRPGILSLGIAAAAEWMAEDFSERTGIHCDAQIADNDELTDDGAAAELFRILQQAFENIRLHAGASQVKLTLVHSGSQLILRVQDNGRGITEAQINDPRSLGILEMNERAVRIGGAFSIQGNAGTGTTVTVFAPVRR
ncbi:MAG TPA: sensor histidine kinase [Bryobacteraceae bacterium]|nr:sensor histidine kinase [Bryobacteraceae bacterium]